MISMKLEFGGLFQRPKIDALARDHGSQVRAAVVAGMQVGGKQVQATVRKVYSRSVQEKKRNFSNVIGIKVYDKKPNEMPELLIGTRAPLVAAHAFGANIAGKMLIPLLDNGDRIGRKRFKLLVRGLLQSGNAGFRRVGSKTILFAEAGAAKASGLNIGKFRRAERARRGGVFRKQKGKALEVPIAVLVKNVHVRQVFPFASTVHAGVPVIAAAIQAQLKKI